MSPLEYALVVYAKMYVTDPKLHTNASEALRPLERKIAELCGDDDWYPDLPPSAPGCVIFFWWAEPEGKIARCIVDTKDGSVHWYSKKSRR